MFVFNREFGAVKMSNLLGDLVTGSHKAAQLTESVSASRLPDT